VLTWQDVVVAVVFFACLTVTINGWPTFGGPRDDDEDDE
jgi:hypothetical protein